VNGRLDRTIEKLRDKAYRDAYVEAHVNVGIPHQIRALREQEGRKWSQGELGERCGKPRNVISRLEDPTYGGYTIRTLLQLASAFDVALLVKFVSYSRFLKEFEDVSPSALEVPSFCDDRLLFVSPQYVQNVQVSHVENLQQAQEGVTVINTLNATSYTQTVICEPTANRFRGEIYAKESEINYIPFGPFIGRPASHYDQSTKPN
jgi:transcriptional regulator with XRE-family HTH domain